MVQGSLYDLLFRRGPTAMLTGVHKTLNTPMGLATTLDLPDLGDVLKSIQSEK